MGSSGRTNSIVSPQRPNGNSFVEQNHRLDFHLVTLSPAVTCASLQLWVVSNLWWCGNNNVETMPVAQKTPNSWGFYDMHGTVSEWCLDWFNNYPTSETTNPQGPATGTLRVIRGGSWIAQFESCRSARRPVFCLRVARVISDFVCFLLMTKDRYSSDPNTLEACHPLLDRHHNSLGLDPWVQVLPETGS